VMLRNPVDAAYSLHGYAYRYGHEDISDFEQAWHTQPERLARDNSPAGRIFEYDYRTVYSYAAQVRRVFEHVPAGQRLILVYEEFFADPTTHYSKVVEFLGLCPAPARDFPVVNAFHGVRSPTIERVLRSPPHSLTALYAAARPLFRFAGWSPVQLIRRLNWRRQRKAPLRPSFRSEIERYFAPDIAELETLLGRSLW